MDMHPNRVKQRLAAGEIAIGAKVDLATPDIVEMVGVAGYDFVWIDCEHGIIDLETATHMMRAADATGTTPVVRVPDHNPTSIARLLDAGAMGIIVPNVTTAAEAAAAVAAGRYRTAATPNGRRGACPRIRAAGHQVRNWTSFVEWSNENTLIWLSIESVEGADALDEILAIPDFDAIILGPFDLSVSMGYPGQTTHPAVIKRIEEIIVKSRNRSIDVVGILLSRDTADLGRERQVWVDRGCRILNVVSDRRLIAAGLQDTMRALAR